jgi:putative hydrolase of the HAD superfamily
MRDKSSITDIFFDLDHTLWDFEKNSALTFEKIFSEASYEFKISDFLAFYNPINHAYWKLYRENRISQEDLRYYRLSDTFKKLGESVDRTTINDISEHYIEHLSTFPHLFEGALELLEALKDRYQMHIITNGFDQVQQFKIQNSGLNPYFNQVFTAEKVGFKKPHPQIFLEALTKTNTSPEASLMVGDSLEADILGALNQGMAAVHFNSHGENEHDKCPIVYSLSELKDLF